VALAGVASGAADTTIRMSPPNDPDRTFRILVVDDDESVRVFVERALRQPGYETRVAIDGIDALRVAESEGPFDLLLTDLAMPSMRGDELARRLRQTDPSLKVLYLTGYSDRLFDERTVLWEAEAFLDKPVTVQGLLEAVSLLLVGHLPPRRPHRVKIPGARVRFGDVVTNLETVSLTGALLRVGREVPVGSTWSLVLYLPTETVPLNARVVSCETGEPWQSEIWLTVYRVAVAFLEPSADARRALQRVSGAVVTPQSRGG
jgi:CheY-like chemotaxis protein